MFQMDLFFLYTSEDYSIQTQYYVYDVGDFIADIGGYMVSDVACRMLGEILHTRI